MNYTQTIFIQSRKMLFFQIYNSVAVTGHFTQSSFYNTVLQTFSYI